MKKSTVLRYLFLAVFNSFIVYAVPLTITFESWFLLSLILIIGRLFNIVYVSDRFLPKK